MKLLLIILTLFCSSLFSQSGSWTQIVSAISPPYSSGHYSGRLGDNIILHRNETWFFNINNETWSNQLASNSPLNVRFGTSVSISDEEFMWHGGNPNNGSSGIYNINSNAWTNYTPANRPVGNVTTATAKLNDDETLLFGGFQPGGAVQRRTYIWDNPTRNWIEIFPPLLPPQRRRSAMCSMGEDLAITFGGHFGFSTLLNDTWKWDNTSRSWTEMNPNTTPPAAEYSTLAQINDRYALLYGGSNYSGDVFGETWIWDNQKEDWFRLEPPISPGELNAVILESMDNNKVLLYGGSSSTLTWIFEFFPPEEEPEEILYGDPNNGDGNNDGILDSLQSNVVSLIVKDEYVTIEVLGGCDSIYEAEEVINYSINDFSYSLGQLEFKLPCSNAEVKLYFHGIESLDGYTYRKLFPDNTYKQFENVEFSSETISGNQLAVATLTLTDGGPGDYDGVVNGVIYDPGGPAIPITANIPIWDWWYSLILIPIIILGYKNYS